MLKHIVQAAVIMSKFQIAFNTVIRDTAAEIVKGPLKDAVRAFKDSVIEEYPYIALAARNYIAAAKVMDTEPEGVLEAAESVNKDINDTKFLLKRAFVGDVSPVKLVLVELEQTEKPQAEA